MHPVPVPVLRCTVEITQPVNPVFRPAEDDIADIAEPSVEAVHISGTSADWCCALKSHGLRGGAGTATVRHLSQRQRRGQGEPGIEDQRHQLFLALSYRLIRAISSSIAIPSLLPSTHERMLKADDVTSAVRSSPDSTADPNAVAMTRRSRSISSRVLTGSTSDRVSDNNRRPDRNAPRSPNRAAYRRIFRRVSLRSK